METINYLHLYKIIAMKVQLLKLMESEGLTPAKFADEIGVQRSSISHILSDRNKPSYDFILKILNRFTGVNAEWLINGKGSMIKGEIPVKKTVIQSDLFSNVIQSKDSNKNQTEGPKNIVQNEQYLNTKELENNKLDKNIEAKSQFKVTNVNNVSFIAVFYQDGTFENFIPRS
jgi:transcriptional regulator with XRE-family HTH domain